MAITGFTLQVPGEIRFGRGKAAEAVPGIAAMGARILVVHGATAARVGWLCDGLRAGGSQVLGFACAGEPDLDILAQAVAAARAFDPTVVVACGGGAALDLGKAVAALAPEAYPPLEYLEVVGTGRKLSGPLLPFVAIPTTAGTGAEATKNAVIGVPEHRRKVSLRDDRMLAKLAIVDPALTDGCPRDVTLASGLDACVQVIEPYLCASANPVTDALCAKAIPMGLRALARLMRGEDADARDALAWVSLTGGIALANAGLGAVHGLAGPLGGVTGATHGAICGRLLPPVLATNGAAIEEGSPAAARMAQVMAWITDALGLSAPEDLEPWITAHGLPRLGAMGLDRTAIPAVAEAARGSSSMRANPVSLGGAQLEAILTAAH